MHNREDRLDRASDLFERAALGLVGWSDAMQAFADAVGARTGQLIGIGARESLPFNVLTRMSEEAAPEFTSAGGGNPAVNSRVRVGSLAPELALRDDAHFTIEEDNARYPEFADWQRRHQVGYTCLTNLIKTDRYLIGCAAIRAAGQDGMNDEDKASFVALAPILRRAIRLQMSIEGQQAKYVARSFETLDRAAFVCGANGYLVALSSQAEDLLRAGGWLALKNNCLQLQDPAADNRLKAAISKLATDQWALDAVADTVVSFDEAGRPLVLECARLGDESGVALLAQVVIIAHLPKATSKRLLNIVQTAYGLTPAEASVACHVCAGLGPTRIAERCGITVGTVRTHLKRIFSKTGTSSQLELAATLARFT